MTGMLPDPCKSPSWQYLEGLHPTLRFPALEAAKVGNARQLSSYERQKQHRPRRSRIHCVHEFVVRFATLQERCESHRRVDRQVVRTPFRCPLRLLDFRRTLVASEPAMRRALHVGRARTGTAGRG